MWTTLANFWKYKANELGEIRKVSYDDVVEEAEPVIRAGGASFVDLRNGQNILVRKSVSELIAATFLPNPNKYTKIIHLDKDLANNAVNNLKYVSDEEYVEFINGKKESTPAVVEETIVGPEKIEEPVPAAKPRSRKRNGQPQVNTNQQ